MIKCDGTEYREGAWFRTCAEKERIINHFKTNNIFFFFSSLSQFVLFDEGFWSLFFGACVREREGLLQVYLPYLQGYYIIHGMIIVLTLALGIISFPFFSLFLCLVDTCFNLHVD